MFYLIGISLNIFLVLLLLLKRNKVYSDKVLIVWMALMAVHQMLFYASYSGFALQHPHLLGFALPMPVLHGPMLFLYVLSMTKETPVKLKVLVLLFAPFIMLYLLAIPFFMLTAGEKLHVFETQGRDYAWYTLIQRILILATGIGYVIWSLILIRHHRSNIKQWFSNTEKKELQWLEYLSIGLGGIWLLVIFFDDHVIFIGVVILVLFIGFFGINQLPIFYNWQAIEPTPKPLEDSTLTETIEPTKTEMGVSNARYAKSGLKEEDANELHTKLTQLMDQEALYRKNDLTLQELATRLDTHPNYLSQVINEKEQKNFYTYINNLRVKAFIENASSEATKNYTLLALAFDSGFNSKSTFNKYFKESTGKSPSEYFSV